MAELEIPPETTNLIAAPVLTLLGTAALSFIADVVPEIVQPVLPMGEGSYAWPVLASLPPALWPAGALGFFGGRVAAAGDGS